MNLSRRTVITALPLAAAMVAVPGLAFSGTATPQLSRGKAVVVFDQDDSQGARFGSAFPASVGRLGLLHAGAGQMQALQDLLADPTVVIAGLTSAATFFPLQRLAVESGRRFVVTGDHRPDEATGRVHALRDGLCGDCRAVPEMAADWTVQLADRLLNTPALAAVVGRGAATPFANVDLAQGDASGKWLHSWVLV